jgi:hypothetical protein
LNIVSANAKVHRNRGYTLSASKMIENQVAGGVIAAAASLYVHPCSPRPTIAGTSRGKRQRGREFAAFMGEPIARLGKDDCRFTSNRRHRVCRRNARLPSSRGAAFWFAMHYGVTVMIARR